MVGAVNPTAPQRLIEFRLNYNVKIKPDWGALQLILSLAFPFPSSWAKGRATGLTEIQSILGSSDRSSKWSDQETLLQKGTSPKSSAL